MPIEFTVSLIIFAITFVMIFMEKYHRSIVSLIGALVMVLVGMYYGFYDSHKAIEVIDFNTLGLLAGMMIIVAVMEKTGAFQYLGIKTAKLTKGDPWKLLFALGALTSVLSMILDNVTTIILIVPITIIIAKIVKINPVPILIAEAILSNTGGVGTLVGDPPNIMIGSAAPFSFNDFLVHSLPVVIVAWFFTIAVLKFVYKKELKEQPQNIDELMAMNEKEAITDMPTLKRVVNILILVVVLFLLHHKFHLAPSTVAIIGAALSLFAVSATKDPQKILEKVELSVLLFFASLFVLVGGLEHAGVLEWVADLITSGVEENLLKTALIILWASAILSAIVDNIPLTVAMIPIILHLESQGVPVDILWWALVFGVGFGGNGSPIGATANVIVVQKSEQTDNPITFKSWMKAGASTMVTGLIVATIALILFQDTLYAAVDKV